MAGRYDIHKRGTKSTDYWKRKEEGLQKVQKRSKYTNLLFTKSNGKPNLNVTSKKPVSLPKFNFREEGE